MQLSSADDEYDADDLLLDKRYSMIVATSASAPYLEAILFGTIEIHSSIIVSGSRHSLLEVLQWTGDHVVIIVMDPTARGEKVSICLMTQWYGFRPSVWLTELSHQG